MNGKRATNVMRRTVTARRIGFFRAVTAHRLRVTLLGQIVIALVFLPCSTSFSEHPDRVEIREHDRLTWTHSGMSITCLEFSPNGDALAAGGGSLEAEGAGIQVWKTTEGKESSAIAIPSPVNIVGLAFSPAQTQLAAMTWRWKSGLFSGPVYLCDVSKGVVSETLDLRAPAITRFLFFANAKSIMVVGSESSPGGESSSKQPTKIWDAATNTVRSTIDTDWNVYLSPSAMSADHTSIAMGEPKNPIGPTSYGFRVWDMTTGKLRDTMKADGKEIAVLALERDGKVLATGSIDGTIVVWSLGPVRQLFTVHTHVGMPHNIQLSFDGKLVAAGGAAGGGLWRIPDGKLLSRIDLPRVDVLRFSPNGNNLATVSTSGGQQKEVRIWHLRSHYVREHDVE